jgi:acetyl esterase
MPSQSLHAFFRPDAVSSDTRSVVQRLSETLAARAKPADIAEARTAYASGAAGIPASPKSSRAYTITIAGPAGDIDLRILVPEKVRGAYLYIHGGGWMAGTNDMCDDQLEFLGREAGLACVSVNYRLAPEHVFPAPVEDCLAAARWLIANAKAELGASWLAIGGESAGAHLTAATLLRLREEGNGEAFRAANLMFGCFDLSLTPSLRRSSPDTPFVDCATVAGMVEAFRGNTDPSDPALSPLHAALHDLPVALFSVGSVDSLLDDTLFMHMRWQAAGNVSELAVYPGGVHGFNFLGGELAQQANDRIARFLRGRREAETQY